MNEWIQKKATFFFLIHRLRRADTNGLFCLIESLQVLHELRFVKSLVHSKHSISGSCYLVAIVSWLHLLISTPLSMPLGSRLISYTYFQPPLLPCRFSLGLLSWFLSSYQPLDFPLFLILRGVVWTCRSLGSPFCLHWVCLTPWRSESSWITSSLDQTPKASLTTCTGSSNGWTFSEGTRFQSIIISSRWDRKSVWWLGSPPRTSCKNSLWLLLFCSDELPASLRTQIFLQMIPRNKCSQRPGQVLLCVLAPMIEPHSWKTMTK